MTGLRADWRAGRFFPRSADWCSDRASVYVCVYVCVCVFVGMRCPAHASPCVRVMSQRNWTPPWSSNAVLKELLSPSSDEVATTQDSLCCDTDKRRVRNRERDRGRPQDRGRRENKRALSTKRHGSEFGGHGGLVVDDGGGDSDEEESEEEEAVDDDVCAICFDPDDTVENMIVYCDRCNVAVHQVSKVLMACVVSSPDPSR